MDKSRNRPGRGGHGADIHLGIHQMEAMILGFMATIVLGGATGGGVVLKTHRHFHFHLAGTTPAGGHDNEEQGNHQEPA